MQPLIQKVMDARRDVGFGGGMGRMFGRNRGGNGGPGGGPAADAGGFGPQPSPEAEALQKAIDDNAPSAQIKDALAKYEASQKAKQAKLVQAQEDLRKVLTAETGSAGHLAGIAPVTTPNPPERSWRLNMNETILQDSSLKQLLERMVAAKQLSATDAAALAVAKPPVQNEEDVLRWLAQEYGLAYTTLDDVEPDRQLLSLFPARILLKEELLPLQRLNGTVEVATSRLFATQGLDALKTHDRLEPQAGAGLQRSHPARDEEAPRRRRGHHRHAGRGKRLSGGGRERRGHQPGRSRRGRGVHHPLRQPGVAGRHRTARLGHSPRTVRGRIPHPLPH